MRTWYDIEVHEAKLPEEVEEILITQYVKMDDYDYVVFVPYMTLNSDELEDATPETLRRLLSGCYDNQWYYVKNFFGKSGILGVAYHA